MTSKNTILPQLPSQLNLRMSGHTRMRRLQQEQIDFISEEYGIEFAQITNQVTGEKWLFSGDRRNVGIELPGGDQTMGDWWWDWHNHPSGSSAASTDDMYLLGKWIAAQRDGRGPIQSSSTIYPTGKKPFEFTPINPRVEK